MDPSIINFGIYSRFNPGLSGCKLFSCRFHPRKIMLTSYLTNKDTVFMSVINRNKCLFTIRRDFLSGRCPSLTLTLYYTPTNLIMQQDESSPRLIAKIIESGDIYQVFSYLLFRWKLYYEIN